MLAWGGIHCKTNYALADSILMLWLSMHLCYNNLYYETISKCCYIIIQCQKLNRGANTTGFFWSSEKDDIFSCRGMFHMQLSDICGWLKQNSQLLKSMTICGYQWMPPAPLPVATPPPTHTHFLSSFCLPLQSTHPTNDTSEGNPLITPL